VLKLGDEGCQKSAREQSKGGLQATVVVQEEAEEEKEGERKTGQGRIQEKLGCVEKKKERASARKRAEDLR
jgi:hypothetical protein